MVVAILAINLFPMTAFAGEKSSGQITLPSGVTEESFGENTVYYNGEYFATLPNALEAVYKSSPSATAKVYCKPGADVGKMTHGHVADDIDIYGNGAYVSGGEYDIEIDTYKYNRETGRQDNANGKFLDKDITVKIVDLDGIAAWGQRNTKYTINLIFENCKNMNRVYFTNGANQEGKINVSLNNCSFEADKGSHANTSVYSNASGNIEINNTLFKDILVGININHKAKGVQNIKIENCIFEDCALLEKTQGTNVKTYAAPVRIVAQDGATSNLTANNVEFKYSPGKANSGNGDILLGDGRVDAAEKQGKVTLAMANTEADVMVQEAKYYGDNLGNATDTSKATTTDVEKTDVVVKSDDDHFVVDKHDQIKVVGKKDATCTAEGYTGDKYCAVCDKLIEKGTKTAKLSHNFKDGKCTVCGETSTDATKPVDKEDGRSPETGDESSIGLLIGMLILSVVGLTSAAAYNRKK